MTIREPTKQQPKTRKSRKTRKLGESKFKIPKHLKEHDCSRIWQTFVKSSAHGKLRSIPGGHELENAYCFDALRWVRKGQVQEDVIERNKEALYRTTSKDSFTEKAFVLELIRLKTPKSLIKVLLWTPAQAEDQEETETRGRHSFGIGSARRPWCGHLQRRRPRRQLGRSAVQQLGHPMCLPRAETEATARWFSSYQTSTESNTSAAARLGAACPIAAYDDATTATRQCCRSFGRTTGLTNGPLQFAIAES